jgi:hypothetical protein
MTSLIALALMLSASVASGSATPASDNSEPATPETTVKKEKPKKICKSSPTAVGSRLAKRVCKTEEEWAKED